MSDKHTSNCTPRCNIAHARIALEDKCVRYMIRYLNTCGFVAKSVTHVEQVDVSTERAAIEETKACDISWIKFRDANHSHHVQIIRGEGIDCIPDYTICKQTGCTFDTAMCHVYDRINEYENVA